MTNLIYTVLGYNFEWINIINLMMESLNMHSTHNFDFLIMCDSDMYLIVKITQINHFWHQCIN